MRNFSKEFTEADLLTKFARFGTVVSATVKLTGDGVSRGFGFVTFSTAAEASRAINELHATSWSGRALQVALAVSRDEVQKQQVEAAKAAELAVRT